TKAYCSCTWHTSSRKPVESTMPRSCSESSFENANRPDSSPKRKLLTMNCRSSWVRVSMGPWVEVIDETVHDDLRGEDADERHVVLHANRLAVAKFLNEPADRVGIEDAVLAYLSGREQIVEVADLVVAEERPPSGRAVRLLG